MSHPGLVPLNLPHAHLKIARKGSQFMVWDEIRGKHLVLTPEEWVRQHFMHYLMAEGYPKSRFALESGLYVNQQIRRTDILVYGNSQPILLVECKAPSVKISQDAFDQAARYNRVLKTEFLILTNGLEHFIAKVKEGQGYEFQKELPSYASLSQVK